ncbi:calcium-binding protein [Xylella fastidiosa]|uniref:calcium-binding protein n=1 Tax=Xylella fastidiosa TaxID=2371 RepID=UPI0037269AF0
MSLTVEQANALLGSITTQEQLRDLINQLDIHSSGSITVLYSGYTANGVSNSQILQGMLHNGDTIRVIDTTEAARFLNVDPTTPNWNKPLYQKLEQIIGGNPNEWGTPANEFLFGERAADGTRLPNGAWDTISARFVNETVGEVRTLTGGASITGVFNQTELPRLLNNPNITSVDGLPIADLRRLGVAGSFQAISAQSEHLSGYLKLAINADGSIMELPGGVPRLDSQQYFALTGLEGKPPLVDAGDYGALARYIPARLDNHLEGARLVQDIKDGYQRTTQLLGPESAAARANALRVLGKLGVAADLLSLAVMAHDANAAYASGNIEGSRQIVQDWTNQYLGGLMGGLAEAKAVGLLLTPVYLDGPIGAAVASVLTVAAGVEGTFLGSHYIGAFLDKVFDQLHHIGELSGSRLYDWVTQIGDLFRRLNQTLHTDNASLLDLLHDLFRNSRDERDPLVLDLDGDGIETLAAGKHILFDHDGDGITHASGWVKSDDGLLVLDRNGNGRIDNGSELFGADTVLSNGHTAASGFDALRDLDSNGDGLFSAADARFTDVRVWRDLNQDGQSQANELFTLSNLGIASITLTPTDTQRVNLGNGNVMDARGSYTRTDGRSGTVGNLQLGVDQFYRDYRGAHDKVTISEAARALPAISGSGAVRDLQEAASLSPALLAAVQALLSGTTQGTLRAALDQVIALWASTSTMRSSEELLEASGEGNRTVYYHGVVMPVSVASQGKEAVQVWIQQQHARLGPIIGILEKFNGSRMVSEQNGQIILCGQSFTWQRVVRPDGHSETVMDLGLVPEVVSDTFDAFTEAYAKLKESIYIRLVLEPRLTDYLSGLRLTYNNGVMGWDASGLEAKLDQTWQHNKAQALQDVMDLYHYSSDALAPSGWNPLDALRQMVDRTAATPDGRQALADAGIPQIAGNAEGSDAADLLFGDAGANLLRGGGGDDVLSGGAGNDTLYGGDGNDALYGDAGNDTLYGGVGNDLLLGGAGDDLLDGSEGRNRLEGGAGNDVLKVAYWSTDNVLNGGSGDDLLDGSAYGDTYLFNKGDGHDTLIERDGTDTLVFGAGIVASQVRRLHEGQDVVLDLGNGQDSIRLKDWLTCYGTRNDSADIEQIVFADGTLWTPETLSSMGLTTLGTSGNDTLKGWQGKDILLGGDGDDILDGGDGSNRLEGGAGNDVLKVSYWSADNVLNGGSGDDTLYGSGHADTYLFNKGDGHDTIVEHYGSEKIVFGAGIVADNVRLLREGQDVVLDLGNGHDSIRFKDCFHANHNRNIFVNIEQMVFADGTVWTGETLSTLGFSTLGGDGDDVLDGGEGSNRLEGGAGNDVLKVASNSSDNVFSGGTGDDMLYGSAHSDTYLFNQGDGHDTIIEPGGSFDRLVFGEGITADDVRVVRQGQDVVLDLGNGHDSIRMKDWLTSDGEYNRTGNIEEILFADGTRWTGDTLGWREMTTFGTSGNDTLQGWGSSDILLGGNGDDVLSGDYGDDTLYGEAGDDLLLGDNGNDVLDGGEGHNRLEGGAGKDVLKVSTDGSSDNVFSGGTGDDMLYGSVHSDTYLFNWGDGRDTIVEQGGFDKIVFGEEIAVSDIHVLREGQDVVLDLYNGYDSIRLKDWLTSDGTRNSNADIEQIVFADGTVWSGETLSSIGLKTLGSADNDTLNGWNGRNILVGEDGDDVLKVSMFDSSDNVLVGCRGNDMLYGSSNSDIYFFDQGDGHDTIIEQGGADTLEFGEGLHREEACFTRSGDDLSILFNGSEDQVTVAGWFSAAAHQVESLVFQDGTVLSGEVERLIAAMALSPAVTTMQASVRDIKESPRLVASSIV